MIKSTRQYETGSRVLTYGNYGPAFPGVAHFSFNNGIKITY